MIWKLAILRWILQEFDQSNNVEDIGVCHTKDEVDSELDCMTHLLGIKCLRGSVGVSKCQQKHHTCGEHNEPHLTSS